MSKTEAIKAYTRAYRREPKWDEIFSVDAMKIIRAEAAKLNSTEVNVIACLLTGVGAVSGKKATIQVPNANELYFNTYILVVGPPGCGKTPALHRLLLDPIKNIEEAERSKLCFQECTSAGLLKFLGENDGTATMVVDECCESLRLMLATRKEDAAGMRSNFNKFYSGRGTDKVFSSRTAVRIDRVYFAMIGTAQPHPLAILLKNLQKVEDGLLDRLYVLASRPTKCESPIDVNFHVDANWPSNMLKRIRQIHRTDDGKRYEVAADAADVLKNAEEEDRKEIAEAYRELEEAVASESADTTAAANAVDNRDSKTYEYVAKMAALIHILNTALINVANGDDSNFSVPTIVEKTKVDAALHLVTMMQIHRNEFLDAKEDPNRRGADPKTDDDFITKSVLLYPGKAVTTQMIARKFRPLRGKTSEVRETLKTMGKGKKGDPKFVGKFKRIPPNKDIFYKADWDSCDQEYLKKLSISRTDFDAAYDAPMTNAPTSGLPENWQQYYANLLDHTPDMDV